MSKQTKTNSAKVDNLSEISKNQVWKEAIKKENKLFSKFDKKYSCNLRLLQKDSVCEKPGNKMQTLKLSFEEQSKCLKNFL